MFCERFPEPSSWVEALRKARAWLSHREPNSGHGGEVCGSRKQIHQNLVPLVGEELNLLAGKTCWLVGGGLKPPAGKTRPFCPQPRSLPLLCEGPCFHQGWCTKSQVCSLCGIEVWNQKKTKKIRWDIFSPVQLRGGSKESWVEGFAPHCCLASTSCEEEHQGNKQTNHLENLASDCLLPQIFTFYLSYDQLSNK